MRNTGYTLTNRASQALQDESRAISAENERLKKQCAYYRKALQMCCAPVPFDVLEDGSFRKVGALFGSRVQIAQRALAGQALEVEAPADEAVPSANGQLGEPAR
jgi:hypothetical protein